MATLPGLANGLPSVPPAPSVLYVPAGVTMTVHAPVAASSVDIEGVLAYDGPGDFHLDATTLLVGASGKIVGRDGARGASSIATSATGADGGPGASIILKASQATLQSGSVLLAGSGGAGGSAFGSDSARGGSGGKGGSVQVDAPSALVKGALLTGAGGSGGRATVLRVGTEANGVAQGGDGGASGLALVNGALQALPANLPLASLTTVTQPLPEQAACFASALAAQESGQTFTDPCLPLGMMAGCPSGLVDCGRLGLAMANTLAVASQQLVALRDFLAPLKAACNDAQGNETTAWSAACQNRVAAVEQGILNALQGFQQPQFVPVEACAPMPTDKSGNVCSTAYALVLSAPGIVLAEVDATIALVNDVVLSCGFARAFTIAGCAQFEEAVFSVLQLPALPGTPTPPSESCATPKGTDGSPNYLGKGGNGGNACTELRGGRGNAGGRGYNGWLTCGDGGDGAKGGDVTSADATGGKGGDGTTGGGNGGDATSTGYGGTGGDGGDGGYTYVNPLVHCRGGIGNFGGHGTGGTAQGGIGGQGLCGSGGDGGHASSKGVGGDSGHG
ncbi:MAG TPA: hypothetical protein VM241_07725, partial [Candidatus Thermoplasmatota archaeon]|nr:hypothetical protein [Candidatus Thermoplasmatota archaeon]